MPLPEQSIAVLRHYSDGGGSVRQVLVIRRSPGRPPKRDTIVSRLSWRRLRGEGLPQGECSVAEFATWAAEDVTPPPSPPAAA